MPLYAYRCKNCDHLFEKHQRMTEEAVKECPVCEGEVRRLINNVGVVFKGSGFYITDNRNSAAKGKLNGNGKSSEESKSGQSKGDKSSSDTSSATGSPAAGKTTDSKGSAPATSTVS